MKQSPLLGVNVDHVATLRQARYPDSSQFNETQIEPDCVEYALACERAGAHGITMHLREDRRHVQDHDMLRAREVLTTRLNFEMACTEEMVAFACQLKPDSVCLVPEKRAEVTTEGGLDVAGQIAPIKDAVDRLSEAGIQISLFIDPEPQQVEASKAVGGDWIELHTGAFANNFHNTLKRQEEIDRLSAAARLAHSANLTVNLGHGINYRNVASVLEIPFLNEMNIGHSIISRSVFVGVEKAVQEMLEAMQSRYTV